MPSLKSQSPLKHPQTHSPFFPPLPGLGYHISGEEIEVCGSASPRFFSVIHAWLAGLPGFPAPLAADCCHNLQFLIQTCVAPSHGPPGRVLSLLSFSARSHIVPIPSPALSLLLPKPHGQREPQNCMVPTRGCHAWV